ncbi:hypothetical protein ACWT_0596 [Actinoplanes sp. SE50]|uniref:hypothetical protein n=1 Tax=unclassified Actinoplanes TaxID=2626549 RepID=UPI00023ECFB6|nr:MULTISPECIES: hypothetical protein [unclassified Actinoplanes]AEV81610.1 hypothetical protein ACPL_713 [Actinoplanes sp. SE50/110]ATO80011.1 hypothetical protein ACWT_0596 [Actinoplanes sp. SE50]SLL97415.1 uncharacterized protein ACSP50_0618 [Actinoplanes sp. SE50/110]
MPDQPGADATTHRGELAGEGRAADPTPAVPEPQSAIKKQKSVKSGRWSLPDTTDDALHQDDEPEHPPSGNTFRLAAFGALLIVVLFAGYGLGRLNNGTATPAAAGPSPTTGMVMNENMPHTHGTTGTGVTMAAALGGLSLSSDGLTLHPAATSFDAGHRARLSFVIDGPGGAPVTSYAIVHDKPLHLIIVRRDLTGFQHLHPTMATDGTWSIDLTLDRPGAYRMITDFTALAGGRQIATTLGTDLTVAGDYAPQPLPPADRRTTTGGFTVSYEGAPNTQAVQPVLISVTGADGRPATVEPYLGAFGHLVVLRRGDVAYLHIHPELQPVDGKVKFWVTAPGPGDYRMFFDFQVAGQVHTAEWTLTVG